ncbi:MAG: IclR family transcriptional regulator C-terminal domain-containing protein, partial [Actinomycetota bacterium]
PDGEVIHVSDLSGQVFPLHAVPSGLAALSCWSDDEIDGYLSLARDGQPFESQPVLDAVAAARVSGIVESRGEHIADVTAFAAPLRDASGVIGGIYVQGPSFRFPAADETDRIRALLGDLAGQANERLVHR